MRDLRLYDDYTREDVHDVFSPDTRFTPQAGTWGLHGIVPIPDRPGDFVFFVTFGQQQGEHIFDEGITSDGVLTWQSQPRQTLSNPIIQQFIAHDELSNAIYLFLRTNRNSPYTYLGRLKYLTHDPERENPVWFQWQILDWSPDEVPRGRMGLKLTDPLATGESDEVAVPVAGELVEAPTPIRAPRQGVSTPTFQVRKTADRAERDARNRKLGVAGEKLVVAYEMEALERAGRSDLAQKVHHVALIEGDGAGYDVLSWTQDGQRKYIEVKTTCGGEDTTFYLSSNELARSVRHASHYYLYRVFDYDADRKSARFYMISGNLAEQLELTATQYRACPGVPQHDEEFNC